jgi:hypothetical protein
MATGATVQFEVAFEGLPTHKMRLLFRALLVSRPNLEGRISAYLIRNPPSSIGWQVYGSVALYISTCRENGFSHAHNKYHKVMFAISTAALTYRTLSAGQGPPHPSHSAPMAFLGGGLEWPTFTPHERFGHRISDALSSSYE